MDRKWKVEMGVALDESYISLRREKDREKHINITEEQTSVLDKFYNPDTREKTITSK